LDNDKREINNFREENAGYMLQDSSYREYENLETRAPWNLYPETCNVYLITQSNNQLINDAKNSDNLTPVASHV